MTNAIQKRQQTAMEFVQANTGEFAKVLPKSMNPDRMARLALSALRINKNLQQCSIQSLAVAIMGCSVLGLEPNTPLGHAYLVPFKKECTLIIGYRGYIELFYRSGAVSSVQCHPVFEGDTFDWKLGLSPDIEHIPSRDIGRVSPEKLTHVYPVVRLVDSSMLPIWDVYDRNTIESHRMRSAGAKSGRSTPWDTDYIAMAQKTGIRKIHRWVPFSVEKNMVSIASAYEGNMEIGAAGSAINMLGDDAAEITHQLVGDIQDVSSEDVDKMTDMTEKLNAPPTKFSTAKNALIEAGKGLWGDEAMKEIGKFCRANGTTFSDVKDEQCIELIGEISKIADKS